MFSSRQGGMWPGLQSTGSSRGLCDKRYVWPSTPHTQINRNSSYFLDRSRGTFYRVQKYVWALCLWVMATHKKGVVLCSGNCKTWYLLALGWQPFSFETHPQQQDYSLQVSVEEAERKPGSPVSSSEGPDVKHSALALRLILSVESKRERALCSGAGLWPYPRGFPSVAEVISTAWQSGWPSSYVDSEDSKVMLFAFCPPDPPANGRCTAPQLL